VTVNLPRVDPAAPVDVAADVNALAAAVEAAFAAMTGGGPILGPGWPTVDDVATRLGLDPSDPARWDALPASLAAVLAMVARERADLFAPGVTVPADAWQGVVILAALDYRAANTPNGFAGYDGGLDAGDGAERSRAHRFLRIGRFARPRVG
jgi:hypothetical protein